MRLTAIEHPKGLILKFFYWISKKQYGKVLVVLKVIYAHSKPVLFASMKILSTDNKLSLPKETESQVCTAGCQTGSGSCYRQENRECLK